MAMEAVKAAAKMATSIVGASAPAPDDFSGNENPPPTAPGHEDPVAMDERAFYSALNEVRVTESAIDQCMQKGGCLEHYTLKPDDKNSINCDMWLGGLKERTVMGRGNAGVCGMAFASLEKRSICAYGCCKLDKSPCCGFGRCCLYRRYKLAIKSNGDVAVVNDFPFKRGCAEVTSCFCALFTCLTCGEIESKNKYEGTLCVSMTKDGKRILKIEEGIRQQRQVCQAAVAGAQRRGNIPDAVIAEAVRDERPFWRKWNDSNKEEPPVAVAVPMER